MRKISRPFVIEITEEAYKQNSVYRPWVEIRSIGTEDSVVTSLEQRRTLKVVSSINLASVPTKTPR
ncbi:MAG: hypothetical protein R3E50_00545 [Halioglobus sp.]